MKSICCNSGSMRLTMLAVVVFCLLGSQSGRTQTAIRTTKTAKEWLTLAGEYGEEANSLRKGRITADLSTKEVADLTQIYHDWIHASRRVLLHTLDLIISAWYELSVAATFGSDRRRAEAAFWRAQSLDKRDCRVYLWGLEMFQEKWGGDPVNLTKVAHLSAAFDYPEGADVYLLATELFSLGYDSEAKIEFRNAISRARTMVRRHPEDASVHATLGNILVEQSLIDQAIPELQTAIRLDPSLDKPHYQLGKIYAGKHMDADAAVQFREVARITDGFDAKFELASVLAEAGKWDEAEKLVRELVGLRPNEFRGIVLLGRVLVHREQYGPQFPPTKRPRRISPKFY